MKTLQKHLRREQEAGFIVSMELVFIAVILVIGLIVGWVAIRDALVAEMHDTAVAIENLNQSYLYTGNADPLTSGGVRSQTVGSSFADSEDIGLGGEGDAGDAGDNVPITFGQPPLPEGPSD